MHVFLTDRKLKQLREDFDRLESRFKGLETEWSDVYDKLTRMMARIVKSRARMEEMEAAKETVEPTPITLSEHTGTHHGLLSERQKEIQQSILRRRAGG